MSKVLRRPMFRMGGPVDSYNTGIVSGLDDEGYADGGRVSAKIGGFFSNIPPFLRPTSEALVGGNIPKMPLKDLIGVSDASKSIRELGRFARPYLANPLTGPTALGLGATLVGMAPGYLTDSGYEIEGGEEEQFIKDYGADILGKETSTGEAIASYYSTKNQKRAADLLKRGGPGDKEEAEKLIKSSTPQTETQQPKEKTELDKLKEFYKNEQERLRKEYESQIDALKNVDPMEKELKGIERFSDAYRKMLGYDEAKSQSVFDALLAASPAFFQGRNLREAAPQVLKAISDSKAFEQPRNIKQAAAKLAIERESLMSAQRAKGEGELSRIISQATAGADKEILKATLGELGPPEKYIGNISGSEIKKSVEKNENYIPPNAKTGVFYRTPDGVSFKIIQDPTTKKQTVRFF